MRKILILMSLHHVGNEKEKLSYHKFTVRIAEKIIKKAGQNIFTLPQHNHF